MSEEKVYRYCGRDFSEGEVKWIRELCGRAEPKQTRQSISRALCEHIGWYKPDGGLKDMSARVALLRMHRDGLIELPSPTQGHTVAGSKPMAHGIETDPPGGLLSVPRSLDQVRPLEFQIITKGCYSRMWMSFMERYHYLGYKSLPGAQMRYLVRGTDGEPLALLGFGAAAWKTAPRDRFIGWSGECRQRNLGLVVNNARFLILPWIRIAHLASHILGRVERRLQGDWEQRYALRPVLLETFCEIPRFSGTCYLAANWIRVGQTQGRGKLDTRNQRALPVKDIWLKPLQKNWKTVLNS